MRTAKNKILFITNTIPHYRLPLYEEVGKRYDLTIAHPGNSVESPFFEQIALQETSFGIFINYKGVENILDYDVIIVYANVRLLNLYYSLFLKYRYKIKVILFGIGVSASYNKQYDKDKKVGILLKAIMKKVSAAIFYDAYPTIKYASMGVDPRKLFVAPNTVVGNEKAVLPRSERNSILFIGSLYKQKGIQLLLEAYLELLRRNSKLPVLNIIGDGAEKAVIENWINKNNLANQVYLLGRITDEVQLSRYFSRAICCVSPGQAGLSVQKSFSYGVPFITSYYPISGGEFTSIIEGVTGYYFDGTIYDLAKTIDKVINDSKLDEVIENCRVFYEHFRSPKLWVKGFSDAIQYALNQ